MAKLDHQSLTLLHTIKTQFTMHLGEHGKSGYYILYTRSPSVLLVDSPVGPYRVNISNMLTTCMENALGIYKFSP